MRRHSLSLAVGPSTARLDIDAAASGRSNTIVVLAGAPGSAWAHVTWLHDGQERERFCYQLVPGADGYQIAVLTPMTPVPR